MHIIGKPPVASDEVRQPMLERENFLPKPPVESFIVHHPS
jgi:hypothetical protein